MGVLTWESISLPAEKQVCKTLVFFTPLSALERGVFYWINEFKNGTR